MRLKQYINEEAYMNNIGFEEMVMLYKKANKKQLQILHNVINANDLTGFKKLVQKILGIKLK